MKNPKTRAMIGAILLFSSLALIIAAFGTKAAHAEEKEPTAEEQAAFEYGAAMGHRRAIQEVLGVCWDTEIKGLVLEIDGSKYYIACKAVESI